MRVKNILDDILKAKRRYIKVENNAKSTYQHKNKFENTRKQNANRKNTEVLVKITSSGKNIESVGNHVDYISRNGKLDLITSDEIVYQGKEGRNEIKKILKDEGEVIPHKNENKKEKRETLNIVFSMKGNNNVPEDKMKKAVFDTMKRLYPDNLFVVALHNDTNNPHCHVILKVDNGLGKRINPKKSDLQNWRVEFSKSLNSLGIEATARTYKPKQIETQEQKAHHYKITSFGVAPYQFNQDEKESYYIQYETTKGEKVEIWSKDLERVVKENNIQVGEFARFAITRQEPVSVTVKQKQKDGSVIEIKKDTYKSLWDCSIQGRKEQKLNPIKVDRKAQYSLKNENVKGADLSRTDKKDDRKIVDKSTKKEVKKDQEKEFER